MQKFQMFLWCLSLEQQIKHLSVDLAKGTKDFVTNFKQIFLDGVGHWSQQERPDLVNEAIENNLKHD